MGKRGYYFMSINMANIMRLVPDILLLSGSLESTVWRRLYQTWIPYSHALDNTLATVLRGANGLLSGWLEPIATLAALDARAHEE